MPIISSSYTIDTHTQRDGSRYVRERHVSGDGRVFDIGPYQLPIGSGDVEAQARVDAHAQELNDHLAEVEAGQILGS